MWMLRFFQPFLENRGLHGRFARCCSLKFGNSAHNIKRRTENLWQIHLNSGQKALKKGQKAFNIKE
jgi:hypothetical protein